MNRNPNITNTHFSLKKKIIVFNKSLSSLNTNKDNKKLKTALLKQR